MVNFFKRYMRSVSATICGRFMSLNWRNVVKNKLTVFVYHDVTDEPSEFSRIFNLYVTPRTFQAQVRFIKKHFNVINPKELLKNDFQSPAALITFDDGFKSYFTEAVPVLEQENVPSINFLSMASIRGGMFWPGLLTYLTCKDEVFNGFIRRKLDDPGTKVPLFLLCRREWVNEYLDRSESNLQARIREFVGNLGSMRDLEDAQLHSGVFLGNHLYNHEVSSLLSDQEFLTSYSNNEESLKGFANSCSLFSFPFGQPETCFKRHHLDLLKGKAEFVFSSSCAGRLNTRPLSFLLDRIVLEDFHNSPSRIWHQIARGARISKRDNVI